MKAARPSFTDSEIWFLLGILRDAEAVKKRQILSLQEEQHNLQRSIFALQTRMFSEGPLYVYKDLKDDRERLEELNREWLPICDKQAVILHGLTLRMEKILKHRRGGPMRGTQLYREYLAQVSTQDTEKTTVPLP
jgi:hypothetical protein